MPSPAFQFYASDWAHSVQSLTLEERGAYITLLAWSWEHGQVPNDMRRIASILGVHVSAARRVCAEVLKKWHIHEDTGQWFNRRLEKVRAERERFLEKQSTNGLKGGRPRKQNPTETQTETQRKAKSKPNTKPNESSPISDLRSSDPQGKEHPSDRDTPVVPFEEFWRRYPKKTGKGDAERVWAKLRPSRVTMAAIVEALAWQVNQTQWTRDAGKFIPNPSTWLNQRRWEDEPFHPLSDDPTEAAWESLDARIRTVSGE